MIALSSSGAPSGQTPSVSLDLSGPANVLLRLAGLGGFVHNPADVLPAGTTTLALSELAGQSTLAGGYYALGIVVVGGGGNYQFLTLVGAGSVIGARANVCIPNSVMGGCRPRMGCV